MTDVPIDKDVMAKAKQLLSGILANVSEMKVPENIKARELHLVVAFALQSIRNQERETCAKIADQAAIDEGEHSIAAWVATAIRTRGE